MLQKLLSGATSRRNFFVTNRGLEIVRFRLGRRILVTMSPDGTLAVVMSLHDRFALRFFVGVADNRIEKHASHP